MTPDFIIGGAPKCGTTSLHQILDQHPEAWVAKNELYFFDVDDPIAHGDFLEMDGSDLSWRDPRDPAVRDFYENRFAEAPQGCLIGEDTTTYLMSDVAAFRIQATDPKVKVIFMLRDPVKRAFSQYWHLLRSGRTCQSFEKALSNEPSIILGSTYAPRLRSFYDALGPARVHVVLFEEFKSDQQSVMNGVTEFLGLSPMSVETVETWHNRTKYPARAETLLRLNRVGRILVRHRYARHFKGNVPLSSRIAHKAYRRWFRFISRRVLTEDHPPSDMRAKTRAYLCQHLSDRNAGLSKLLGKDLSQHWPGFSQ
ncbi:sulfotransferase family protein [Roseobacter weihaiensis]|uniref:sulfotransferase family protein n=1 Tax=Roseobacter weihaiensis TaxID=2763262 RepID=UPI001D0ABDEE|nr:sulfotransferase [Roseobacter sp. H9]